VDRKSVGAFLKHVEFRGDARLLERLLEAQAVLNVDDLVLMGGHNKAGRSLSRYLTVNREQVGICLGGASSRPSREPTCACGPINVITA